jgi:uncharacterized protein (TIGR03435 family)
MMRLPTLLPALLAAVAFGQPPARPEFEVASIRASAAPAAGRADVGVHIDGAQVRFTYLSLRDYLQSAYAVKDMQIVGPEWLASARFDIAAKVPPGAARQIPEMLQVLLADRFQVKVHRDTREFPVYGLVVARNGLQMQEAPAGDTGDPPGSVNVTATGTQGGVSVNLGKGSSFTFGNNRFEGKKLTMANIAETFTRFLDRPVIDMTGLPGRYDFTLEVSPEDYRAIMVRSALNAGVSLPPEALRALDASSGDSVINAAEKLGLKLDPRKTKMDVIVVDSAAKTPTEN